jgi:hypothetical protein
LKKSWHLFLPNMTYLGMQQSEQLFTKAATFSNGSRSGNLF